MKVFFSHASEDKPVVEAVAARLVETYPELDIWIDKYEIVAGEDLLDAIGRGMDEAQKFFVFLSPTSVAKPWVKAELYDALTQEINGIKPGFVVPVMIAKPETVPPFLRAKKYIDLNRLPPEWLLEFKGAIVGISALALPDAPSNLRVDVTPGDSANEIKVWFRSEYFAEEVRWTVQTSRPVVAERHFFVPN